ncbi:MAG: hypothetical protein AABM29_10145 [Actinomycetota bacterium]
MKRIAIAGVAAALVIAGCGDEQKTESSPAPSAPVSANDEVGPAPDDAISGRPGGPGSEDGASNATDAGGDDPYNEGAGGQGVALEATVRSYLSAINRRDGSALCQLLVPGALDGVRLPARGAGCAASVTASIGHAQPGGLAWRKTSIDSIGPAELDRASPGQARVRATIVTLFRGGREPSIEDDLVYLERSGTAWLVAKPSAAFYRAIGSREIPLSALAPP